MFLGPAAAILAESPAAENTKHGHEQQDAKSKLRHG
jgi:hypothetical protein